MATANPIQLKPERLGKTRHVAKRHVAQLAAAKTRKKSLSVH
jgi:hypothetical protein